MAQIVVVVLLRTALSIVAVIIEGSCSTEVLLGGGLKGLILSCGLILIHWGKLILYAFRAEGVAACD